MSAMRNHKLSQAARAATALCSTGAIVVFAFLVSNRYNKGAALAAASPTDKNSIWGWDCLSLVGLGISVFYNVLSFLILSTGNQFWFPRRFHLIVDLLTALLLVVLGYVNFIYQYITVKRSHGNVFSNEMNMEYGGIVLLSISCIAHYAFFLYRSKRVVRKQLLPSKDVIVVMVEKHVEITPPSYSSHWRTENPFDDVPTPRTLPAYEVGPFDERVSYFDMEKTKKQPTVEVLEVEDDSPV